MNAILLNSEASLNNFIQIGSVSYSPGEAVKVAFRLINDQLDIRLIPGATATVSVDIANADGTTTTKSATVISADDRSMWSIDLDTTDTQNISGSNMEITLTDGADIKKAIVFNGLIKQLLSGDC